jgi:hypothetical protein
MRHTRKFQGSLSAIFDLTDRISFTSRLGGTKLYTDSRRFNSIRKHYIARDPLHTTAQFDALKQANPAVTTYAYNSLDIATSEALRWNWDNFVNINLTADTHNFDITLGMSAEKTNISSEFSGLAYDVPQKEQYWSLNLASEDYEKQINQIYFTPNTLLSYFGRVQYNYDQRYFITGTLRRDGSSRFANTDDYYEFFPSVGLAWTISNEDFMSNGGFVNYLKLRASWGRLGNQSVPFNTTLINTSTNSADMNYVFGPNQDLRFGAAVGAPARDISWEIVEEWNVGFDISMLENQITGNIDVYQKTTENVILEIQPIPNSQFGGRFYDEGGEVVNRGVEMGLNWNDNIWNDLFYTVGVKFAYNHNEHY